MKNKKGFTLIELLAVIVILAIIAIIAVPIILNVIEKSKESSAVDSAYGYIHAIEEGIVEAEVNDNILVENKEYEDLSEFENTYNIGVKGNKPKGGSFILTRRQVSYADFVIDDYNIVCEKRKCESTGKMIILTYKLDGGILSKKSDKVSKGGNIELPRPTKEHYAFNGWFTEPKGKGTKVDNETIFNESMILYAYFIKDSYEIVFDGNGGTPSENTTTVEHGDTITLPDATRTGYTFNGWYTEREGGEEVNNSTTFTESKTLYAHYTKNIYTVTVNKGTGISATTGSGTYSYEDPVTVGYTLSAGYEFNNWTGDKISQTFTMPASNVTMQANGNLINYTISYTLNGGSVSGNPVNYNVESGNIILKAPSRSGYIFTGWTGSNGTTPQTSVTISSGSTGDKNYTANWQLKTIQSIYGYTSSSTIPWNTFKEILDTDLFDASVVGAQVTDSNGHNWRIIRVGSNYYDLWYQTSIGNLPFSSSYDINSTTYTNSTLRSSINGSSFYNNTSLLPTSLKSYIIRKSGYAGGSTNSTWGTRATYDDYVWLLTYVELGSTGSSDGLDYSYIPNNTDGSLCPYFASKPTLPYSYMQTPHSYFQGWDNSIRALVMTNNYKIYPFMGSTSSNPVVPAIRVQ